MTACLRDLADDGHNEQMRTWMKQVREVAYDVEDCIDAFCHHLGKHSGTSCLRRMIKLLRTMRVRHKLAAEIKSLQSRAQKVSDRRLRYRLDVAAGASSNRSSNEPGSSGYLDLGRRLPALHGDGSRLVGMGGRTDKLVGLLEQGDAARHRVVSIVGFGGLGKTTLAMTVYTSPAVRGVQCRAFVAVSQTYDLRSLLESVLKQTYPVPSKDSNDPLQGIKDWDIAQLVSKSRDYLKDKRYLIVLDDVWRPAAWENLRIAFPDNDKQSRILITTRSQQVARNCCTSSNDHVYNMEPLPTKDSEQLFFKTVFESDACPPQYRDLENVSKAILKKCSGLPLAIVSIGGMLARRQNKTQADWQRVCDRLGSELETNPTLEGMRRILTLSYNDLPYNLKACFLYLSAFPENYEIRSGPLVRRWAAEGLIAGMHELSLEEIAQSYFDEFVSRSIVIPGQLGSGGVRSCKVHDIMLGVIASKSVQENFISFLGSCQYSTAGHDKIRRLSIHPGEVEKAFSSKNLSHARSLTILGSTERPVHITFTDMKLLRVLDLEGCPWLSDQDLKDICRLSLLRYLNLRSTPISQLPNVVGKLKELVTLDVRDSDVTEFPRTITQLQNLKHLLAGRYTYYTRTRSVKHVGSRGVMLPPGLKNMCGLQRVPHVEISTSYRAMREVEKLSQLTRLCAINESEDYSTWQPFVNSLNKLSNSLRYLSVVQRDRTVQTLDFLEGLSSPPLFLQSLHLWARLSRMPPWVSSLRNLASVSLRETYLGAELVEALGKLPNLLSLKLYTSGYVGDRLCFEQDRFPRLKQLIVDNERSFHELSFRGGAPNLERLTLACFHHPNRGISGMENLLKLREIEFFSIIGSLADEVIAVAKNHPNRPKVTRDDRPMEAT